MRLSPRQRHSARAIVLDGARMMLRNPDSIHYTQGGRRWDGINKHLRVVRHQYPKYGDCSSTATWLIWNALTHALKNVHIHDVVNGEHWAAGYTGTMANHGKRISHPKFIGDCCFYGSGWPYDHVTVYIGGGYVFSHGGEAGPFKLPVHYRGDFRTARRYILAP